MSYCVCCLCNAFVFTVSVSLTTVVTLWGSKNTNTDLFSVTLWQNMDIFVRTEAQMNICVAAIDQSESTEVRISISCGLERCVHLEWLHHNDHRVMWIISINHGGWWNEAATPSGVRLGPGQFSVFEPALAGGWQQRKEQSVHPGWPLT